jgi:anti-sigma regulatory factor (Ser/Thr protein kinase)
MNTIAPLGAAVQRPLRVPLLAAPAAAAQARTLVTNAIRDWDIPVDPQVAGLLTSELVTNAIRHENGEMIRLFVTSSWGHLRVYVHDTCRTPPLRVDAPTDAEAGRGLMLVASLSSDWGHYRTPTGKAVYFTLAFETNSGDYALSRADRSYVR